MIRKLRSFLCTVASFSAAIVAQASDVKIIRGQVIDQAGNAIGGAFVRIYNPCDRHIYLDTGNSDGSFLMQIPPCTSYQIQIYYLQSDTFKLSLAESDQAKTVEALLHVNSDTLRTVSIDANPGAISVKSDKIVILAEKISPGAAATLLDLLMRCPGVVVDEQHNLLQLKGRAGVLIMLENRLLPLGGEELFNWLKNTPAGSVDKIELISNPSARYDASGNAGIINLVLKKTKQKGWSGNLSTATGQGRYGKLNEGGTLNYKNGKWTFFNQYNYALRKGFNQLNLQRNFLNADTFTGSYVQRNYLRFPVNNHTFRSSIDFMPGRGTTLGASVNANASLYDPSGKNYSEVIGSNHQTASFFSTINNSKEKHGNVSANFYLKQILDTLGSNLTTDLDVAKFINIANQLFTTEYFNAAYQKNAPDYLLQGNLDGFLNIAALKCDLIKYFLNHTSLEAGVKASRVIADNDVLFADVSNGTAVKDSGKSNHFIYIEQIGAAYSQFNGAIKKWQYLLGGRYEYTDARGLQKEGIGSFRKKYGNFFPSATLQKVTGKGDVAGLSVSRRLQRPQYQLLNPFKFYLDPSTYKSGNPDLNPEFTWNTELSFTKSKGAYLSLSISQTRQMITEVLYPSETEPKTTVQTNKNLGRFRSMIVSASTPLKFGKKSNGLWSVNAGYQQFSGNIASTELLKGSYVLILSGMQNFKINDNWSADMNAMFQSGQLYAYMYLKALGQLGFGCQRTLLKKQATLKLNVTDIFFTGNPRGETAYKSYTENFTVKRETRVAMITFSYRFGSQQNGQRRRQGGAEEENQRAQGTVG